MSTKEAKAKAGSNIAKGTSSRLGTVQPAKRTCDELSDTSLEEITILAGQVDGVHKELKDIKTTLKDLIKKDEITALIKATVKTIVEEVEDRLQKSLEYKIQEKTQQLSDRLDSLVFENCELKDTLGERDKQIKDIEEKLKVAEERSITAMKRANYNEQYSRKNNVKVMGLVEQITENTESLTRDVCSFFEVKANVRLRPEQIVALHRLPGKPGQPKPVLMKMRNSNDKTTVMKSRKQIKEAGYKLVDDVTKLNGGLIGRLLLHDQIESAWYFNGYVYGKTTDGKRHRFDLYDSINQVIAPASEKSGEGEQDMLVSEVI